MIKMTSEEMKQMIDRIEHRRETLMEEDDGTNKRVIGGYIIRHIVSDNERNYEHVVRDRNYYKELSERLIKESMDKIKDNFRQAREG